MLTLIVNAAVTTVVITVGMYMYFTLRNLETWAERLTLLGTSVFVFGAIVILSACGRSGVSPNCLEQVKDTAGNPTAYYVGCEAGSSADCFCATVTEVNN